MPSTRDIRRRIKSVKNTAQITKAMQMVAAAKMRKAQQAALVGRPYAQLLNEIMAEAATRTVGFDHPLLQARPVAKRAVILVGTDRGLVRRPEQQPVPRGGQAGQEHHGVYHGRARRRRNLLPAPSAIWRRSFITRTRRNSPRPAPFRNSRSRCF